MCGECMSASLFLQQYSFRALDEARTELTENDIAHESSRGFECRCVLIQKAVPTDFTESSTAYKNSPTQEYILVPVYVNGGGMKLCKI